MEYDGNVAPHVVAQLARLVDMFMITFRRPLLISVKKCFAISAGPSAFVRIVVLKVSTAMSKTFSCFSL